MPGDFHFFTLFDAADFVHFATQLRFGQIGFAELRFTVHGKSLTVTKSVLFAISNNFS